MARFIPNLNTYLGFSPVLPVSLAAPTIAEVTAVGVKDLTHYLTGLNASATGSAVPTPAFDQKFESSIDGTVQATMSADFYYDDDVNLAWETLPRGTKGCFYIARFGGPPTTAGDVCETWPVTVLGRAIANMANNQPVSFAVTCSVPSTPSEDSVVAA